MPEGYSVDLLALDDYITVVNEALANYTEVRKSLDAGMLDASGLDLLVGKPQHGGAPADFAASCQAMLASYVRLYGDIRTKYDDIVDKLTFMQGALTDTHGLYQQMESDNAVSFTGILNRNPDSNGGEHSGTARLG